MYQTTLQIDPMTIAGRRVSLALWNEVKAIRGRGGKCFLAFEEVADDEERPNQCSHCNGSGIQYLQQVTGGPYDSASFGKGAALIYERGKWYAVSTSVYYCPVCRPMGK